jgi:uncharacterized NAD-dependent epimerase/dehydratase family protein
VLQLQAVEIALWPYVCAAIGAGAQVVAALHSFLADLP